MRMLQRCVISLVVMICFCCVPLTWASSTKDVTKATKAVETKTTQKETAVKDTKKATESKVKKMAPLDLNTATVDELKTLDGIGDKKAEAIVDYRKKNGPFKSPEDIMKVSGIGEGLFNKNKSMLSVGSLPAAAKTTSKKK